MYIVYIDIKQTMNQAGVLRFCMCMYRTRRPVAIETLSKNATLQADSTLIACMGAMKIIAN